MEGISEAKQLEIEELRAEVALLQAKLKRAEPPDEQTTPDAGAISVATSPLQPVGPTLSHTPEGEHAATSGHMRTTIPWTLGEEHNCIGF